MRVLVLFTLVAGFALHAQAQAERTTVRNALEHPEAWRFVRGDWSLGDARAVQTDPGAIGYAFYQSIALTDVSIRVRFRVYDEGGGVQAAGLVLCSSDSDSAYFVHYDTRHDQVILFRGGLRIQASEVARAPGVPMETGRWYSAQAEARNGRITAYLDGQPVLTAEDKTHEAGLVGLYTSQGHVEFEDLEAVGVETTLAKPWEAAVYRQDVPKEQRIATVLAIKVLCKQPGRYIGWPSIAQAPNGDLLVVFSGDRTAHVSPDGKVQMIRSQDRGDTWSDPVTVFDTPIDDRDSGIIRTAKDAMLVSWFTGPGGGESQGHWVVRSTDNGRTWGDPVRTEVTTPHGPTQLSDGRILFVGQRPHESHGQPYDVGILESRDDGMTWQTIGTFPVPEGDHMLTHDECHVVECADGRLVIAFRDCFEPHRMRQAESTDGGRTWSGPHVTPVRGYPPHVIRLRNGSLLAVYGKRWPPYGEYACISRDNGETWDIDDEVKLAGAPTGDLGYPASVQLDDATIWTVYYQADQPGEKPCLMGTHWRLRNGK